MNPVSRSLLGAFALVGAGFLSAEEIAGLPLHIKRLNPATIRVWLGDSISSTATVAVATRNGIVVIDTMGIPSIDREVRKVIARELGRKDFKVLINSHEHGDHTGGNQVYADCAIVAHELCGPGMQASVRESGRASEWQVKRIKELESEIGRQPAAAKRLGEELILARLNLETRQSSLPPTLPTRTFKDSMTLNMGDTTFELYFVGGLHTASDIDVLIPEHGLLMTGDTMADEWLTDTPGCLASFVVRPDIRHDFPLLFKNWETLRGKRSQIKELVPGHWNGTLSWKGFEDRCRYVEMLWNGVNQAVKDDRPLDSLVSELALKTKFPALINSPGITPANHFMSLAGIWSDLTKTESAAAKLHELALAGSPESSIHGVLADRGKRPAKFYFLEGEINARGYQLLQEDKPVQALVLFKANVALSPRSWNAYDSLAEAYLKAGDSPQAIANYRKSLELNPENRNGKQMLEKLQPASATSR